MSVTRAHVQMKRVCSVFQVVMSSEELLSVDYEVFGRVQGVFFRKYTQVKTPGRVCVCHMISTLEVFLSL